MSYLDRTDCRCMGETPQKKMTDVDTADARVPEVGTAFIELGVKVIRRSGHQAKKAAK